MASIEYQIENYDEIDWEDPCDEAWEEDEERLPNALYWVNEPGYSDGDKDDYLVKDLNHGENRASYGIRDRDGDTLLHYIVYTGKYLYLHNTTGWEAFINTPNNDGKTPLDIVTERIRDCKGDVTHLKEIESMLRKHRIKSTESATTKKQKKTK